MARALAIQAKHDAMGEGEGGLVTGPREQAPWHPVLAAQPMYSFPGECRVQRFHPFGYCSSLNYSRRGLNLVVSVD